MSVATNTSLPSQSEIQANYDSASEAGVSPCMWVPPEFTDGMKTTKSLPDNTSDPGPFTDTSWKADWKSFMTQCRGKDAPGDPQDSPDDDTWPNPFSSFEHIDDEEFSARSVKLVTDKIDPGTEGEETYAAASAVAKVFEQKSKDIIAGLGNNRRMFRKAVAVLKAKAFAKPDELKKVSDLVDTSADLNQSVMNALGGDPDKKLYPRIISVLRASTGTTLPSGYDLLNRRDTVNHLQDIVGPGSAGMKRLAQVFEWTLWRTTLLLQYINDAVKTGDETAYTNARQRYINFIRDLDDHEPEKSDTPPIDVKDKDSRSGYGRAMKWNCIEPVIFGGQIIGVRVVVKWNPHSSSSGNPLPDGPPQD